MLALFAGVWVCMTGFDASVWRGTPGRQLVGIQVVTRRGRRIAWLQSGVRRGAKPLPWDILPLVVCSTERRGWHDLLAGARVVTRGA